MRLIISAHANERAKERLNIESDALKGIVTNKTFFDVGTTGDQKYRLLVGKLTEKKILIVISADGNTIVTTRLLRSDERDQYSRKYKGFREWYNSTDK